jgi:hypothetical protein
LGKTPKEVRPIVAEAKSKNPNTVSKKSEKGKRIFRVENSSIEGMNIDLNNYDEVIVLNSSIKPSSSSVPL